MKRKATDSTAWTEWHEGIPAFAGATLEALYGSLYSSLPQLSLGNLDKVSTYFAGTDEEPQALFLYKRDGRRVRVVNEGMPLAAADATRFASLLFQRFRDTDRVAFHAVELLDQPAGATALRFTLNEDIVIDLPGSEAAYLASLGKSTRKSLRQSLARTPGLTHRVLPGPAVDARLVDELVGFNHARLAAKQRTSALDRVAARQLLMLIRACGMAGVAYLDGRLCGGTLACRFGDDVYSLVNAHDPAFDHLGMGNLGRHLMIGAAIEAGARRFHLLGGNFSSKRYCGARRQSLQTLLVYRSRWRMLTDLPQLAVLALRELRYRCGVALDESATALPKHGTQRSLPSLLRWLLRSLLATARQLKQRLRSAVAAAR